MQALLTYTKSGRKREELEALAKEIVEGIDMDGDGRFTRREFMRMPMLRVGEAPALLMQAVNNIRTGYVIAEVS